MKKLIIIIAIVFMAKVLFAQGTVIQGQVSDKDGPIIGATVIEKDMPGNGAATDLDGKFKITLRGKSRVLLVRAVSYLAKEVTIGRTASTIYITLDPDTKGLEEVVVVGFGTTKKATLTGSVSSVSGQDIRRNPSASLQNTLAGRLPGFSSQQTSGQPGSDGATFYVRGTSSYTGSNQPLIIVDDIEFTYAQFARLDANEIESLSILKDASTTAIYGIKGANGVILVTTRRGKIGPPAITFRTEYALSQPTKLPKFLNAYETAKLFNQAKINDGQPAFFSDADLEHWRTGDDPYGHPDNDWNKILFRKYSYQWRNNLDVSGGNDFVRYFVSVGAIKQNGIVNNFQSDDVNNNFYYNRYNYRSNLDIKATKTLNVKLDLFGNIGEQNAPEIPSINGTSNIFYFYNSFLTLSPYAYPITNPNGSFGYSYLQPDRYVGPNLVQALTLGGYNRTYENNMNLNASATQRLDFLTKGLSVRAVVAYGSTYSYTRGQSRGTYPSFVYNTATGVYTPRDPNVFRVGYYNISYSPGSTTRTINPQASINYDNTFGSHHVYALALYNTRKFFGLRDPANTNRVLNFIPVPSSGYSGRVGYDYKSKYVFELDGAYNKTDVFAEGKKFGFFPAASLAYNISEEPFFKDNIKFIDRLKFRGSYGLVGSDDIGAFLYSYLQTYSQSGTVSFGNSNTSYNNIYEGRLANTDVTWEKEKKLDIGAEISMFQGKLTSTFTYFNNNRYDILTSRGTVSYIFGQALPPVNLGKTNNRGFEAEIAYSDKINKDFNFRIGGNVSVAKNKIVFQDEANPLFEYQRLTGNPIGTPRQYSFLGFYRDATDIANSAKPPSGAKPGDIKYADLNGDGIITDADQSYFGYSNTPNTVFGINLSTNYKTFSLNVLFQGSANFNVAGVRESIQAFGSNLQAIHQQSWTPELGDNAKYPILSLAPNAISIPTSPSDFWNVRGDYIRLKSVELSYTIPQSFVNKVHLKNARLYVNGTNLITWSKLGSLYEYDPEISTNNTNTNYPPQRLYNLGLSVTF